MKSAKLCGVLLVVGLLVFPGCKPKAEEVEVKDDLLADYHEAHKPEPTPEPRPEGIQTKGGMQLLGIPAGSFDMGCTAAQKAQYSGSGKKQCSRQGIDSEAVLEDYTLAELIGPMHRVTLSHDFWLGKTEVTQGQWKTLMGGKWSSYPSHFKHCGADCPVESVNHWQALEFANAVSREEGVPECYTLKGCRKDPDNVHAPGITCRKVKVNTPSGSVYDCEGYRLPTEAEWEYAARAGTDLVYAGSNNIGEVAWFADNSNQETHQVAMKTPNAWGLYDMTGNVSEWTWDWYGDYDSAPQTDPTGVQGRHRYVVEEPTDWNFVGDGRSRVWRGGNWGESAWHARVARRKGHPSAGSSAGCRLARTIH